MNILVLNCGSSSLKFQLIATDLERIAANSDQRLAHGQIERIGGAAIITFNVEGDAPQRSAAPVKDIRSAVEMVVRWIASEASGIDEIKTLADIHAVGHRVVHGGEHFTESAIITGEVLRAIEDCIELAPLHNPANIKGIVMPPAKRSARALPQVAVFDTAFHQTLPERAFLYALPYQLYRRHKIRRYGFHGTSHRYVAYRYRTLLDIPREQVNIITLHLGNGCSIAAIKGGNSIDTSMGLNAARRLGDGNALRRSGRGDYRISLLERRLDRAGSRKFTEQTIGIIGHFRLDQRYARTARRIERKQRPPRQTRRRDFLLSRRQIYRLIFSRDERRGRDYFRGRHRRKLGGSASFDL